MFWLRRAISPATILPLFYLVAASEKEDEKWKEIQMFQEGLGKFSVAMDNSSLLDASEVEKTKSDIKVMIQVNNYSGFFLGDARVHIYCGNDQETTYNELKNIAPRQKTSFLFENYGPLTRTCGSISWQVKKNGDLPYFWFEKNEGLRLELTWNVVYSCRTNMNEMSLFLTPNKIDPTTGDWKDQNQKNMYSKNHGKSESGSFMYKSEKGEKENRFYLFKRTTKPFQVLGSIGFGCFPILEVNFFERASLLASIQKSNETFPEIDLRVTASRYERNKSKQISKAFTWTAAFLILCLGVGVVKACLVMNRRRKANRRSRSEEMD